MAPKDVKVSRPNWSQGQNFGLGLGLVTSGLGLEPFGLGLKLLTSVSKFNNISYGTWCP